MIKYHKTHKRRLAPYNHKPSRRLAKQIFATFLITSLNLHAGWFSPSAKECVVNNMGRLSFLQLLIDTPNMKVKEAVAKLNRYKSVNVHGEYSGAFVSGKKEMISEVLELRASLNHAIAGKKIRDLYNEAQANKHKCMIELAKGN